MQALNMALLDSVSVDHLAADTRQVTLSGDDLLALYTAPVDYLVVSSLPHDYDPSQEGGSNS